MVTKKPPLVSIIITTKNEEKNIAGCLESIKLQTYPQKEIEIIVVDNNSTDKTKIIARRYGARVFNKGPERSQQRNFGMLEKSRGKYLVYLDADMILSSCLIEKAVAKLQQKNLVALYVPEIVLGDSFWSRVRRFERSFYDGTAIDCVRIIRKNIFQEVGGFDLSLTGPEDWDFDKRVRSLGKVAVLDTYDFEKLSEKIMEVDSSKKDFMMKLSKLSTRAILYHNEIDFSLSLYLNKKSYYSKSFAFYIRKWHREDTDIKKQFGFNYRFLIVFLEDKKWTRLLKHPFLIIGMYFLRLLVGGKYILSKINGRKKSGLSNLSKLFQNQLVAGSIALFIGSLLISFGNYLYHFLMGRMLGPINYGILASLISLTYLLGIPVSTLGLVVVKYVSALRGKKDLGAITILYYWLRKKLITFGLLALLLLFVVSPLIAAFLHLESRLLVVLVIISSLIGIYTTVNNATLQGFLRFRLISILGVVGTFLKLLSAVFLIYLGWQVLGVALSMFLTSLASLLLTGFFVAHLLKHQEIKGKGINSRNLVKYAVPVFFSTLAFTSLYTTDVILARHFLSATEAGFYAALATLGKVIFFATSPIIVVMFPMISEHHANGKTYLDLLGISFGLVALIALGITGLYFILPQLMVKLLFGSQYLAAAKHLYLFAIFLSLYSLASLLVNFYLSIKKVKIVILPILAAFAQAGLIFLWHRSLSTTVGISIGVSGGLFLALLVYFCHDYRGAKRRA